MLITIFITILKVFNKDCVGIRVPTEMVNESWVFFIKQPLFTLKVGFKDKIMKVVLNQCHTPDSLR